MICRCPKLLEKTRTPRQVPLKPLVQLGAESFNPDLICRWHKRHDLGQLQTAIAGLARSGQDFGVFILLSDYDTTAVELLETMRLLVLNGLAHRRMRLAVSPLTIPLYDSDTRRSLEFAGRFIPQRIKEEGSPQLLDQAQRAMSQILDARFQPLF